jgi:3-oxoadipate enol-lactonase
MVRDIVQTNAVDVRCVVTGRADGPAVVLSNSLGSTHHMWAPQLAALEERFLVIRYDTRGHGASPVPTGPYSVDDLTDDVVALLDGLGVEHAHVVGLSLGGMTAMRLAARNPDRVKRVVLLSTAAELAPPETWFERAATVRAQGSRAVAEAVVARWFTPEFLESHPETRRDAEQMVSATPAEGYAACCEAIAAFDVREQLSSITAPTLAIAGAEDLATPPARLEEIVSAIPGSRLLVVEHAAHLANAEQPGIVTGALVDHLAHLEQS